MSGSNICLIEVGMRLSSNNFENFNMFLLGKTG